MSLWSTPTIAAVLGIVAAAGLLVAGDGAHRGIRARRPRWRLTAAHARTCGIGTAVGAPVWWVTGWPVAGAFAAIAATTLPRLLTAGASRRARVDRIEAIGAWAESLRDSLAEAAGVEQAIVATSARPPAAIADDLGAALTGLRQRRQTLAEALTDLQVRLDDPIGDLVIAQLLIVVDAPVGRLAATLTRIAAQARHHVDLRLDIEADRAPIRTELRMILVVTVLLVGGLRWLRPQFLAPYHSLIGQTVLAAVGGLVAAGLALMAALSRDSELPRILFTLAASHGRWRGGRR
jgi:tight adherence protein B